MSLFQTIYGEFKKKKRTSDHQYSILEHTPILHDADQLNTMYKNATNDYQKAAVFNHIKNFDDITHDWDEYTKITNKMWDDYP